MRSSVNRLIIFAATILISVIIGFQLYWLNKTYAFEKNEFTTAVTKSIRGLYEDLDLSDAPNFQLSNLIEHPSENSFVFKVDEAPEKDSLMPALMGELDDFEVFTACKVVVYDAGSKKYLYQQLISNAGSFHTDSVAIDAPLLDKHFDYVYLNFPNREKYILGNMQNWIITSALLLILLIGLGASVYFLYRQKSLNDIQKDFINNVTHEFSTPLAVIDLSTDALAKPANVSQPERFQKYLSAIRYQSEYLKKHIQTLVNTVVTDKYQMTMEKVPVNPNELVRTAVAQLEPIIIQKHGSIQLDLEEDVTISADHDNLYLAIFNIISNAVKYSTEPKVYISTKLVQHKYQISTKDNGIGIAQGDIKKIFRKFFRAQNGNIHNSKGLGLGLYFSKKIIDLHHGQIEVNSVEGIGTEFRIILPVNG